jgi:hypothetical protein
MFITGMIKLTGVIPDDAIRAIKQALIHPPHSAAGLVRRSVCLAPPHSAAGLPEGLTEKPGHYY